MSLLELTECHIELVQFEATVTGFVSAVIDINWNQFLRSHERVLIWGLTCQALDTECTVRLWSTLAHALLVLEQNF